MTHFSKKMLETLSPFSLRQVFLDVRCIDTLSNSGGLEVLVVKPNTNGNMNHQKHFFVGGEPGKLTNRLKTFLSFPSLPAEGEILV